MSRSRPCKISSQQIPILCAAFLLIGTTALFFVFVCPHLATEYSIVIPVYEAVLTLIVLASFANASFRDPGIIPRADISSPEHEDDFKVPLYNNVDINGITVRMKWCDTCKFYRPPRCSHCSICNNCIEHFDHHCPWVDNCIGRRNYRYFFFFVLSLSLHIISVFLFCLVFVLEKRDHIKDAAVPIAIMVVCGLSSIPVIGLTVFHIGLVAMGRTTNEQVTGKFRSGHNPFDQGCKNNCGFTLCSSQRAKYIGYSVNLKESKMDKQKEKRKANSSDAKAKNQTDGTELTDIKVEVSLNHTNQQLQDGIKDRNNYETRNQDGRSVRPDSFAAAVNTAPRVSATYVKSSINGRTITGSREVTV